MRKLNGQAVAIEPNTHVADRAPGERTSGVFLTEPVSTESKPSTTQPKIVLVDTTGVDPNKMDMAESDVEEDFETYPLAKLADEPVGLPGNYRERIKRYSKLAWITSRPGRAIPGLLDADGHPVHRTRKQLRKELEIVPDPEGLRIAKRCGSRHNNGRKRRSYRDVSRAERLLTNKLAQAELAYVDYSHFAWPVFNIKSQLLIDDMECWDRHYARLQATMPSLMRAPATHGWIDTRGNFLSDPRTDHQCELYAQTDDGRLPLVLIEQPLSDEQAAEILRAHAHIWDQEPNSSMDALLAQDNKPFFSKEDDDGRRLPSGGRKPFKPRRDAYVMRTEHGFEHFPVDELPDFGAEA